MSVETLIRPGAPSFVSLITVSPTIQTSLILFSMFFFFKQKTEYDIVDCDWSSDVCSSDL